MALIKCPECKKKISDQCENCPHCGYPIKNNLQDTITEVEVVKTVTAKRKPFYKKIWVWVVAGIVLAALVLGLALLLTHNTKPKLDKEGNPIFVELTNEVYTNAKKYKGYFIDIKGKVFQVLGDNGATKGIQIWIDPDTCEQNMMIYYNTDVEVKQGDYIICSGYIDSLSKYINAYGAKAFAPLVCSTDLKKATYIDVMAPTNQTITPTELKYQKLGYSISVDNVEFSEKETRIYLTATNNGKSSLHLGEAVIVQDGKQYKSTNNFEANYAEIPYEIVKGASCSGIIVFPAISANDFKISINMYSSDSYELFNEFAFVIGKTATDILDFGYKSAVQTMFDFRNGQLDNLEKILPQTLWECISTDCSVTIREAQEDLEYWYTEEFDSQVHSFKIENEERISQTQLKDYLNGLNSRYGHMGLNIQSISDGYRLCIKTTKPNGKTATETPIIIKIDDNWYWTDQESSYPPCFATGPFTPAA